MSDKRTAVEELKAASDAFRTRPDIVKELHEKSVRAEEYFARSKVGSSLERPEIAPPSPGPSSSAA
ncbi:MAG: hypothetical protein ACYC8T_11975 [Myxococcaceae bacterium]